MRHSKRTDVRRIIHIGTAMDLAQSWRKQSQPKTRNETAHIRRIEADTSYVRNSTFAKSNNPFEGKGIGGLQLAHLLSAKVFNF